VHKIEEVIIKALAHFGISAERLKGYPGVWVRNKKIAAIGMNCSKWFTSHGFAINVNPDLDAFRRIVPCGINDRDVTSLEIELKLKESLITTTTRTTTIASMTREKVNETQVFPGVNEVKDVVLVMFCQEFNCDLDIDTTQLEKMMI
jgi:lipoate-protein ligase B